MTQTIRCFSGVLPVATRAIRDIGASYHRIPHLKDRVTFISSGDDQYQYCFAKGTLVLMADGSTKAIEKIEAGEMVLAAPENDPEATPEPCRVLEVYHNQPARLLSVTVASAIDPLQGDVIRTTAEHPFYVREKGWTKAIDLVTGDRLQRSDAGWLRVRTVADSGAVEPVFNLRIDERHTYFVSPARGTTSILVHNDSSAVLNAAAPAAPAAAAAGSTLKSTIWSFATRPITGAAGAIASSATLLTGAYFAIKAEADWTDINTDESIEAQREQRLDATDRYLHSLRHLSGQTQPVASEGQIVQPQLATGGVGQVPPTVPAVASPGEPADRHHRLPRQFRDWFQAAPRNIDIDQYLRPLTPSEHTGQGGIHPEGYNEAWAEWIKDNPNATRAQVFEELAKIEAQFGLAPPQ